MNCPFALYIPGSPRNHRTGRFLTSPRGSCWSFRKVTKPHEGFGDGCNNGFLKQTSLDRVFGGFKFDYFDDVCKFCVNNSSKMESSTGGSKTMVVKNAKKNRCHGKRINPVQGFVIYFLVFVIQGYSSWGLNHPSQ